jgi:hypothetical protein
MNQPQYAIRLIESDKLSAENLSRSHVLVIPNPGYNESYSSSELEVIGDFVNAGGALFLLGDYQVPERIIGNPTELNKILQALSETRVSFTTFSQLNEIQGDAIIDPNNSLSLPYNIQVNSTEIIRYPNREVFGIGVETLLIAGGSLSTNNIDLVISTGASTSQAVSLDGQLIHDQPPWLAAFWTGSARIVLCSSTTMFSDTKCAGTNSSWFQSVNNSLLWSNIFQWMSQPLVYDPTPIMIFVVALVLIAGVGLLAYLLVRKRRVE